MHTHTPMRIVSFLALSALGVAVAPLACGGGASEEPIVTPSEEGAAEDDLRSLKLSEAASGRTVTVTQGQNLTVQLQSSPSTGYKWSVVSTDRTFGYPATTTFLRNGDAVGSGGIERLTWKT